jgi:hypothetical protein
MSDPDLSQHAPVPTGSATQGFQATKTSLPHKTAEIVSMRHQECCSETGSRSTCNSKYLAKKCLVILYPCALLPRKIEEKLKDTLMLRNITGNLMALSRRQN